MIRRQYLYIILLIAVISCHKDSPAPSAPWEILRPNNKFTSFQQILFIDENRGFINGAYNSQTFENVLLKTTDGGKTWKEQKINPPTVSGFFNFFIVNENVIYTSGFYEGPTINDTIRIFKSTDGGNTWNVIQGNYHQHPGAFFFWDENNGIVTYNGIYKTTDGGKTWTEVPNPNEVNFFWVARPVFTSRNVGFAAGGAFFDGTNFGTIVRTTDGGDTWQDISANVSKTLAKVTSFFFVNDHIGFLFTVSYQVYKTTDGGNTWNLVNTTMTTERPYFLNENEGYIAAFGNDFSGIYHTTDGARTWRQEYALNKGEGITGISFPSPQIGYAITNKGLALKKTIK